MGCLDLGSGGLGVSAGCVRLLGSVLGQGVSAGCLDLGSGGLGVSAGCLDLGSGSLGVSAGRLDLGSGGFGVSAGCVRLLGPVLGLGDRLVAGVLGSLHLLAQGGRLGRRLVRRLSQLAVFIPQGGDRGHGGDEFAPYRVGVFGLRCVGAGGGFLRGLELGSGVGGVGQGGLGLLLRCRRFEPGGFELGAGDSRLLLGLFGGGRRVHLGLAGFELGDAGLLGRERFQGLAQGSLGAVGLQLGGLCQGALLVHRLVEGAVLSLQVPQPVFQGGSDRGGSGALGAHLFFVHGGKQGELIEAELRLFELFA